MTRRALLPLMLPAAAAATAATNHDFLGVWRAEIDGALAIVMTLSDEGDKLTGAILFYKVRRDPGEPARSSPGLPEPLFRLASSGQTLDFEVSHRRSHGARTRNDPPARFRMTLSEPGRARLRHRDDGIEVDLTRD